ncbi:MAG TPA: SH3 domain-containing protein [Methylomirabilota bacterium]|jgi:hypothetical protein|nr:SH3 domain-containing protein [Methylomirabilota bacterium]
MRYPRASAGTPGASALAGLLVAASLVAGCAGAGPTSSGRAPAAPAPESPAAAERARREQVEEAYRQLDTAHQQLRRDHQRLQRERQALLDSRQRQAAAGISEEEIARLRLQLLERDAQIKALTQKLDATIVEVVRAMAKLRSLESKAEAATTMAEAEIAMKMLERTTAGRDKDPDVAQAEQLLKLGAQEFRKDNYSGALYLSTQAKSLLKGGQPGSPSTDPTPRADGEVAFALPLPLRLVARTEVREGPGPSFKVAFVLADGVPVTAHSYKGLWVRIRRDDGRGGWVLYSAVGPQ